MAGIRVLGGRYRLIEQLGSGGMSVVWRAYDEVLGRQVAVKVLPPGGGADDWSRARIRTEARQAARLAHPYIMSVHDYGESPLDPDAEAVPFVVMELVTGPTLADRIEAGPLPVAETLRVCAQVAAALAAAHARGVVHRDIKPSNIMLSPSGAKVLDFGIAAAAGEADSARADGEIWGTPAYLAPERLEGGSVVPASDVYALGLMLYRLLAGELPWRAETTTEMIKAHRYVEPAPLPYLPGVHSTVREICARCLAKDPAERPAAGEVARVLAASIGRHSRAVATAVGRSRPPGLGDPHVDTRAARGTRYRNARPGVPRTPDGVGVLAEESGGTLAAEPVPPDSAAGGGEAGGGEAGDREAGDREAGDREAGDREAGDREAGDRAEAGGEAPGEFVVDQPPASGASAAPGASARRPGAAVDAVRVPLGSRSGRRPRRRTALAGAAVLVAVALFAGYCAAGDRPDGAPHAGPTASAPATGSAEQAAPAPSASAGPSGQSGPSGAAPDSPIQPWAAGGYPGTVGGDGSGGAAAAGVPGPGPGDPGPGDGTGPAPEPPPVESTFDTVGGTVTARCVGPTATLVGYDPLPGFVPSLIDRGPGPEVGLTLSAVVTTVRIGVRCDDGVPVASIG